MNNNDRDMLEDELIKNLQDRLASLRRMTCKELSCKDGYCAHVEDRIREIIKDTVGSIRNDFTIGFPHTFNICRYFDVDSNTGIVKNIKYTLEDNAVYENMIPINIEIILMIDNAKIQDYKISHKVVKMEEVYSI